MKDLIENVKSQFSIVFAYVNLQIFSEFKSSLGFIWRKF